MSIAQKSWDAVIEEKFWRENVDRARDLQEKMEKKSGEPNSDFVVLCLSELDASSRFTRPECFLTREVFLAELRRLIAEPTMPSRPVPSTEGYQRAQKMWLEFLIEKYEGGYQTK